MTAWTTATATCAGIAFSHSFASGITADADGISTVHVRTTQWAYAPDAAAVTHVRYIDDPTDDNDGRIVEADMEIDAVDYTLLLPGDAAPANPTKPVLYLRAVVTHEMGHLLGLAHDCGTGTETWPTDGADEAVPACASAGPAVQAATMYYQVGELDDGPSTIKPSDIAGACAIAAHLTCAPDVVGTCSAGRSSSCAPLLGVLLLVVARRRWEA